MVHILCNPGLRQRHWEKMSETIGFNITPDSGTSLRKMIRSAVGTFPPTACGGLRAVCGGLRVKLPLCVGVTLSVSGDKGLNSLRMWR